MTWWADLYDDLLAAALLEPVDDAVTARTVDFLVEILALQPGDRVFDQCAGTGRLAIPLAARGYRVAGVEQAASYVSVARAGGAAIDVGDAFTYVPDAPCRGAFNWWTGFGYLEDDADNARMLRRAHEALAPGGRFALDFVHAPQLLRQFRAEEVTRGRGVTLHRASRVELARGLLHKRWTFTTDDGRVVERASTLRLYHPHELVALMRGAGFEAVRLLGDVDHQALHLDSPRCIVVGSRA